MIRDYLNIDDTPMEEAAEAGIFHKPKPTPTPTPCDCNLTVTDTLPVGMVYAVMQEYKNTYSPADALSRGTLFRDLDLPFRGGEKA